MKGLKLLRQGASHNSDLKGDRLSMMRVSHQYHPSMGENCTDPEAPCDTTGDGSRNRAFEILALERELHESFCESLVTEHRGEDLRDPGRVGPYPWQVSQLFSIAFQTLAARNGDTVEPHLCVSEICTSPRRAAAWIRQSQSLFSTVTFQIRIPIDFPTSANQFT